MSWILALVLSWLWSALVWGQVLPFVGPGTPHTTGGGGGAPTFVTESESTWTILAISAATVDTPATAVTNGDLLVAVMLGEDSFASGTLTASTTVGSTSAWTTQVDQNTSSNVRVVIATATASATGNVTARVTRGTTSQTCLTGINMLVFRNHGGVGANAKTNGSGAPSLNITTTKASSAVVVANGDWAASDGATRTWRTNAGTLSEVTYFRDSARATMYAGYHANAGSIATYAVGLTLPSSQTFAIAALEVKGP